MRKAQAEILGIAFVVVLIVFAGIIYVSFAFNRPRQVSIRSMMQISILKDYYITAMLDSTTTCNGLQFKTILNKYLSSEPYTCNGESLSDYVKEQVPQMLSFLNDSGYCYQFAVFTSQSSTPIFKFPEEVSCQYTQSMTAEQAFVYNYGTAKITLTIYS